MKNGNKNLKRKINELKICFNINIFEKIIFESFLLATDQKVKVLLSTTQKSGKICLLKTMSSIDTHSTLNSNI